MQTRANRSAWRLCALAVILALAAIALLLSLRKQPAEAVYQDASFVRAPICWEEIDGRV